MWVLCRVSSGYVNSKLSEDQIAFKDMQTCRQADRQAGRQTDRLIYYRIVMLKIA